MLSFDPPVRRERQRRPHPATIIKTSRKRELENGRTVGANDEVGSKLPDFR